MDPNITVAKRGRPRLSPEEKALRINYHKDWCAKNKAKLLQYQQRVKQKKREEVIKLKQDLEKLQEENQRLKIENENLRGEKKI